MHRCEHDLCHYKALLYLPQVEILYVT